MIRIFLLPVFLLFWKANPGQTAGFVSVSGTQIVDAKGKAFQLRGTNLGNWLVPEGYMFKFEKANSPRLIQELILQLAGPSFAKKFWEQWLDQYISAGDIHYLKSIGVNSIRIPFHYKLFTDEEYLGGKGESRGFRLLDRVISWCRQESLYVILDMHCAPGGQTGDNIDDSWGYPFLFEDSASQELTATIWKKIAAHYAKEPVVIGYDLLNEPIPHYLDTGYFNPKLEPLYKKIAAAVRSVDKVHLLFIGGAQWDSNFDVFGKPFDQKSVYTFHKYWTEPTRAVIQSYLDFSAKYQVPVYCGETGENTDEWVQQFRQVLDENQVGWHFWPYKKLDNSRGFMSFGIPEKYDSVIAFANADRSDFEKIRKARNLSQAEIRQAFNGLLEQCRFVNCRPNNGYIKALGFNTH